MPELRQSGRVGGKHQPEQRVWRRLVVGGLVLLTMLAIGTALAAIPSATAHRPSSHPMISETVATVGDFRAQRIMPVRGGVSTSGRGVSKEPWCPATLESGVFGRIEIPRLGISALIAEGAGSAQLDRAVGHISKTAFPGQPGNCALAGHQGGFLRGLGDVRVKDVIRIDTLQDTYLYEVEWVTVVGPHQVDVLDATAAPSLTLVTCQPFHAVGPVPESFVVRARLVRAVADSTATNDRGAFQSQGPTAERR